MKRLLVAVALIMFGVVAAGAAGLVLYANSKEDLSPWHTASLDAEFTAARADKTRDLLPDLRPIPGGPSELVRPTEVAGPVLVVEPL